MAPGGLQPWSKAGIIIKENTSQGSAYAAMMVTGSNGVRMQWDYVNDTPGLAGQRVRVRAALAAAGPRPAARSPGTTPPTARTGRWSAPRPSRG